MLSRPGICALCGSNALRADCDQCQRGCKTSQPHYASRFIEPSLQHFSFHFLDRVLRFCIVVGLRQFRGMRWQSRLYDALPFANDIKSVSGQMGQNLFIAVGPDDFDPVN